MLQAGTTYYIPHYNKLVYCHGFDGEFLILGGMAHFYADARTNIIRQKLHKAAAWKYEFKQVQPERLKTYPWLCNTNNINGCAVKGPIQQFDSDYLVGSLVIYDAPRADHKKLEQKVQQYKLN